MKNLELEALIRKTRVYHAKLQESTKQHDERENAVYYSQKLLEAQNACAKLYCSYFQSQKKTAIESFYDELESSVEAQDLVCISILFVAETYCQLPLEHQERVTIMKNLLELNRADTVKESTWNRHVAILVEQMADLVYEGDERFISIIAQIIEDGKHYLWYEAYNGTLVKVIGLLPKNKQVFEMLKPGLNHSYEEYEDEIKGYIDYWYIKELGLVNKNYEWIG